MARAPTPKPAKKSPPTIAQVIRARIAAAGDRAWSNDNISRHIQRGELKQLEELLAHRFAGVLDALVIDPLDPNSADTPQRLARMYLNETMAGRYLPKPKVTSFPNISHNGVQAYEGILVQPAAIKSLCSHHHQPVTGFAYIGVIAGTNMMGLSKYVRVAQHLARRGTMQEILTRDIANAISALTECEDVAVHISARHGCCENRGVMMQGLPTQTTCLLGKFEYPDGKAEFFGHVDRIIEQQGKL